MNYIEYLIPVAYLITFWYLYILVIGLYRAHLDKRLNWFTYTLAMPAVIVGLVIDVVAQYTIATVVFLDLPKEHLVTGRLKRYQTEGGWRGRFADKICTNLLDVFDPTGNHC